MKEMETKKEEVDNLTKKWNMEQELLKQIDIKVSVKECMNSMLTVLELKDGNKRYQEQINKLQMENLRLRKEKGEGKMPRISLSMLKKENSKLNGSDDSLSSHNSKTRLKISNASFKLPLKNIKKINKSKIKNINISAVEHNNAPLLKSHTDESKLNSLKLELKDLESQKSKLKHNLIKYRNDFISKYNREPTKEESYVRDMLDLQSKLTKKIDHYKQQIAQYDEEAKSASDKSKRLEDAKSLEAKSRSISPGLQIKAFKRKVKPAIRDSSYEQNHKELSPYRNGEHSFFSNANEISGINYTSNNDADLLNNLDVSDIRNEANPEKRYEKIRMYKNNLEKEKKNESNLSEEQSDTSSQQVAKNFETNASTNREAHEREIREIREKLVKELREETLKYQKNYKAHYEELLKRKESEIEKVKQETTKKIDEKTDEYLRKITKLEDENNNKTETIKYSASKIRACTKKLGIKVEEIKDLKKRVACEEMMRKKYYNEIVDAKGKIRVYCRIRPLSQKEIMNHENEAAQAIDQFTVKLHDDKDLVIDYDSVYAPTSKQEEVFEDVKALVQSAIDGFKVCILAYGATGSGKTHTILGTEETPGLCPLSLQEMFKLINDKRTDDKFVIDIKCNMVELYKNNLNDLLY